MRLPGLMLVTMAAFAFSALTSMAEAGAPPATFADLAARVTPAVVNISSTHTVAEGSGILPDMQFNFPPGSPFEEFFKNFREQQKGAGSGAKQKVTALGSGFIIDAAGYVVTNNHVVDEADEIQVTLDDGDDYPAKLVGTDAKTDLALLKIDADKPLPAVTFGDSDSVRVGDWVMAVGNPFGLGGTRHGRHRLGARPRHPLRPVSTTSSRSTPRSTAATPAARLFDLDGEVIGINTAIFSPNGGSVGIGFAIPVQHGQAGDRPAARPWHGRARLARRADPAGDAGDRLGGRPEAAAGRAGRRRPGEQPGGQGAAEARRRHPDLQWP